MTSTPRTNLRRTADNDLVITLTARAHDRVQLTEAELGVSLEDAEGLPWVVGRVAAIRRTRVGVEIMIGPFVGQLVVPDHLTLNVEEIFPGTMRACLSITSGGRRAGPQDTGRGTLAVRAWGAVIEAFAVELATYARAGAEKRYIRQRMTTARPRGRIDIARTATKVWPRGRTDLLACDVRVLTEDTYLNRALLAAAVKAEALARQLKLDDPLRDLRMASMALSGARLELAPDTRTARAEVNPMMPSVARLVGLAEVILDGIPALPPPRLEDAPYPMSAWLNAEKIFEEAVRCVVAGVVPLGTVRAGSGDGVALLSAIDGKLSQEMHKADPDVVVDTNGRVIILDAKYRRHGDEYSQGELYQIMAHARAYGAFAAALVVPAAQRQPGAYAIGSDSVGTAYYVVAVDPSSVLSLEREIGDWVSGALRSQSASA